LIKNIQIKKWYKYLESKKIMVIKECIYSVGFVSKCCSKVFGPKWPMYHTIAITFCIDVQRNSIERKNVI
jgi:hypothetical protein